MELSRAIHLRSSPLDLADHALARGMDADAAGPRAHWQDRDQRLERAFQEAAEQRRQADT